MKGEKLNLKQLSDEELLVKRVEMVRELISERFKHSVGQVFDSSKLSKLRRNIARANTELRSREIAQKLPVNALLGRAVKSSEVTSADGASSDAPKKTGPLSFVKKLFGARS